MPVTDVPNVDERTALVRALIEYAKDADANTAVYRQRHEAQQAPILAAAAAAAAKEAQRERLRQIARLPRRHRNRKQQYHTRPYQALGVTKAEWLAMGSPEPDQKE